MGVKIGIRHEDKYNMERRTALTPDHVKELTSSQNLQIVVQSSERRIYNDDEYRAAGAEISDNLNECPIILGVKEIPEESFEPNKTYIFFSHVIKGQPYNMPLLRRMMELNCNLIDYEKVVDEENRRLIFFGRFAGLAGMINSLWGLGQRLQQQGIANNPFLRIRQSYQYNSLEDAKKEIMKVGREIKRNGLPNELVPLTIGFTGYGNVSNGAQEIADLLPVEEISPEMLLQLNETDTLSNKTIYKIIFKENHISKPIAQGQKFDLQEYYDNPIGYENNFEQYIPHLTIIMNCMYWDDRYPKIFTRAFAKNIFNVGNNKTKVIGDVTCDPEGSIEFTHKGTTIEDPVFVYNPLTGKAEMGFEGDGILVMAVDILPSELPRDSSQAFGDALIDFIKPITDTNFNESFDNLTLPGPIKKALILHKGKLTPEYEYIEQYLFSEEAKAANNT